MSGISLKLKLNKGINAESNAPGSTPAPPNGTRIKIRSSLPPTPIPNDQPIAKKNKIGRAPIPSPRLIESRKRVKDDSDSEEKTSYQARAPLKRVKIQVGAGGPPLAKTSTIPSLVFKQKGKPPRRNPGEGYDSEASDREEDPAIEEQFIIRILDADDHCNYLRQIISEKKIGVSRDLNLKFLDPDGRRAIFIIRGCMYAATLVDLPCILEAMKSWDKRGWWKSADISQMLLVFARIKTEAEAMTIPLPPVVDPVTHQYPHGLTPPMQYARKRRFRKRLHKTQIEAMEDAVEKLLKEDEKAIHTTYEIVDPETEYTRASEVFSQPSSPACANYDGNSGDEYSGENTGELGYYNHMPNGQQNPEVPDDDVDLALEAELEAAMDEEYDMGTPSNSLPTEQVNRGSGAGDTGAEEEDSGDESLDDDDLEENGERTVEKFEDAEQERRVQEAAVRDDILDLEDRISANLAAQSTQSNPILRKRLEEGARKLRAELQLKKSSIGEGED
ncbi:Transcription initiation factor TFIID subunit 7 [Golovinomyces cichoracearum]|uniref:Transcription initiation factor TFIID subunit 7 n=1 Tax=Golovinomyces cichoracearum TaxID=62708 RepID=A0A420I8G7_9PEZI|nr:Transcription initiation factor TFIID subunit 7 [Golovinomyces cichoracearum]